MSAAKTIAEYLGYALTGMFAVRAGFAGEQRINMYNSDRMISIKNMWLFDKVEYYEGTEHVIIYTVKPAYIKTYPKRPRPTWERD